VVAARQHQQDVRREALSLRPLRTQAYDLLEELGLIVKGPGNVVPIHVSPPDRRRGTQSATEVITVSAAGAGYGDPATNARVEEAAMGLVALIYPDQGWVVDDVSAGEASPAPHRCSQLRPRSGRADVMSQDIGDTTGCVVVTQVSSGNRPRPAGRAHRHSVTAAPSTASTRTRSAGQLTLPQPAASPLTVCEKPPAVHPP
jgi:hypothetical protein